MLKLLILGGTTEASALAQALAGDARFDTLLSFAGATRAPRPPPVAYRVGGFGGAAGLAGFLRAEQFDLMIDATHPFASRMKRNAVEAAVLAEVPLLGITRPSWQAGVADRWQEMSDMNAAAKALGCAPRRVWLTIGQKDLASFKAAPWHHYIIRSVDLPDADALPPSAELISARGPFRLEDELALLRKLNVSVLVTKNSGGAATQAKLQAARECGVGVMMVRRPQLPEYPATANDAEGALAWLHAHAGTERLV